MALDSEQLRRIRRFGRVLDDVIRLPGGFRIGLDGIIGLIPGVGDAIGAVASSYIIAQAARLGVPSAVLLRMLGNVLLETVVGLVPFLGDLFDFAWKANLRNLDLLEHHAGRASRGEGGEQRLARLVGVLVLLLLFGIIALGVLLLNALFELLAA